jgi:hypothetical protein
MVRHYRITGTRNRKRAKYLRLERSLLRRIQIVSAFIYRPECKTPPGGSKSPNTAHRAAQHKKETFRVVYDDTLFGRT